MHYRLENHGDTPTFWEIIANCIFLFFALKYTELFTLCLTDIRSLFVLVWLKDDKTENLAIFSLDRAVQNGSTLVVKILLKNSFNSAVQRSVSWCQQSFKETTLSSYHVSNNGIWVFLSVSPTSWREGKTTDDKFVPGLFQQVLQASSFPLLTESCAHLKHLWSVIETYNDQASWIGKTCVAHFLHVSPLPHVNRGQKSQQVHNAVAAGDLESEFGVVIGWQTTDHSRVKNRSKINWVQMCSLERDQASEWMCTAWSTLYLC